MKRTGRILSCVVLIAMFMVSIAAAQDHQQIQQGQGETPADKNNPAMFRKNVSKTPEMASAKAKLDIMPMWFPAYKADDTATEVEYYDSLGNPIRIASEAKPLVIVYTDVTYESEDGEEYADIFVAVSRDDGNTWKRKNISRMADRSSFTLDDGQGQEYFGHCKKPVMQVKGNKIFVAWSSKYAKGGKPRYAIKTDDEYPYDDPYYEEDIWGISGHQGSHDYAEDDFPDVGEIPYSAVWTVRGIVATQNDVNNGLGRFVGDIVWFKPERLTSGRRDAYQLFVGGAENAGFSVIWQEDPDGIRPGKGVGPGEGWSGATTNHKTDIWYSFITAHDFAVVDANFVAGGDPEHDNEDFKGRPKALVPMSLPVRISDNDVVNTENLKVELGENGYPITDEYGNWKPIEDEEENVKGSHAYGYKIDGLCADFYEFTNQQGEQKLVCITEDGRLLDGDTGASRPNIFLQPYTNSSGETSAWAIVGYEETKGLGAGPPEDHTGTGEKPQDGSGTGNDMYVPDEGKNVIYHSFDFQKPDRVSAGNILNFPATDETGAPLYLVDEEGTPILDYKGDQILAYENARRPRFILQGKGMMGASKTVMVVLYKQGEEGMGRPSDIFMRRCVATNPGNPYAFANFTDELQNVSAITAVETWINPDRDENAKGDGVKVVKWEQTEANLEDQSWTVSYDDARAHRGAIRGDFLVIGYSWTPNWAATRNYHDKYDFYIRRSFDGGQTWTTDPADVNEVCHTDIYMDPDAPDGEKHYEVETCYAPGVFEPARNVSLLTNNKETVIEPRIVGVPGTIKKDGAWTGIPEDEQNPNVFYVSYGLAANDDTHAPTDLFWSVSRDRGQTLKWVEKTINPESSGNNAGETVEIWDWLAKDNDDEEGEAQLRMTPNGERFYAVWLREGDDGSDIWFRRIMDESFPTNVSDVTIFQAQELDDAQWTIDLLALEVGDSIFYDITVTNVFDEIMGLTLTDELDALVSFESASLDDIYDPVTHTLVYETELEAEASLTLSFEVLITDIAELGDTIENFVTITWSNGLEKWSNTVVAEVVPEPATLLLIVTGLFGVFALARKRRGMKK